MTRGGHIGVFCVAVTFPAMLSMTARIKAPGICVRTMWLKLYTSHEMNYWIIKRHSKLTLQNTLQWDTLYKDWWLILTSIWQENDLVFCPHVLIWHFLSFCSLEGTSAVLWPAAEEPRNIHKKAYTIQKNTCYIHIYLYSYSYGSECCKIKDWHF